MMGCQEGARPYLICRRGCTASSRGTVVAKYCPPGVVLVSLASKWHGATCFGLHLVAQGGLTSSTNVGVALVNQPTMSDLCVAAVRGLGKHCTCGLHWLMVGGGIKEVQSALELWGGGCTASSWLCFVVAK
jgi:hypothetical protein